MRHRRVRRAALLIVLIAFVALAVYAVVTVRAAERALTSTAAAGRHLERAARAGDEGDLRLAARELADRAAVARSRTDGPLWRLAGHLPVVGDDVRGVRTAARVADELGRGGAADLASAVAGVDDLAPRRGGVSLTAVARLRPAVASGAGAFADASTELHGVDESSFAAPLRRRYRDLEDDIDTAARALRSLDRALDVLPTVLGEDGPQRLLLVVESNAEVRSGGGLPGAVAEVVAEHGRMRLTSEVSGSSFGYADRPAVTLAPAERRLYGTEPARWFTDATVVPDFPRAAGIMRTLWERRFGRHVDAVVALDPVTLGYLLRATGPLTVSGVTLRADDAADYLLHQVYVDIAAPAAQDVFFGEVARAVFDRIVHAGAVPVDLVRALATATDEGRLQLHSFARRVQDVVAGTPLAAELPGGPSTSPEVGFYLDDSTGSKMSYYLRYHVATAATSCVGGAQRLAGTAVVSSVAPADAAALPTYVTGGGTYGVPPGEQLVTVYLFAPWRGRLDALEVNGVVQRDLETVVVSGRPATATYLQLRPGEQAHLAWRMTVGPGQDGPVRTRVTPSVVPGNPSSLAPSACH